MRWEEEIRIGNRGEEENRRRGEEEMGEEMRILGREEKRRI